MTPKILNKIEKEEILKILNEQFGIEKINGMLLTNNYEKFFIYQGSFKEEEISKIEKAIPIEKIGIYFAKVEVNKENKKRIRLSIEGSQIMKNQITKNIFELNEEQVKDWLKGNEILLNDNLKVNKDINKSDLENTQTIRVGDAVSIGGGRWWDLGFVIITHKGDFFGTGKASENKISNFIPKSRRLKK